MRPPHQLSLCLLILGLWLFGCADEDQAPLRATPFQSPAPVNWQRPGPALTGENASQLGLSGLLSGHTTTVFSLALSPTNQRLATLGGDDRLIMWNIASGRSLFALSNQTYHEAVFVADGTRLLTLNNGRRLAAWDSNSGALLAENPQLPNSPSQLRLSPDGQFISLVNVAGEVLILEAQSLVLLQTLPLATSNSSVLGVYFSPDGRRLTAFTNEGRMLTWETQAWTVLEERELGRSILALTATFDHRSVALAHLDSWSRYSLDDGRWQTDFPLPPFREVRAMEFSQDGQWLALGGDLDSALIVDSQTGDWVVTLRGHSQFFSDLALSPNRALILTGVANGGVYLWDLGQFLNQSLSAEQVQVPRAILGQMGPDFRLSDLAWGQDGNYIVLADQRGPVYVLALPE